MLTGEFEAIRDLVYHGFRTPLGEPDPEGNLVDIAHSTKFVLVDQQRGIRGYYETDATGLDEIYHRSRQRAEGSRERMSTERTGLLLINLGTPDSPGVADVRRYLREFLFDPRVIDIHPLKRWLLLNLIILRFRPRQSAEAYSKIWTERGSPLLYLSEELLEKVRERLGPGVSVQLGMRYGQPSIASALERLRADGIRRIVVFPLYPQYSSAATGSSIERVFACASELWNTPYLQFVPRRFTTTPRSSTPAWS